MPPDYRWSLAQQAAFVDHAGHTKKTSRMMTGFPQGVVKLVSTGAEIINVKGLDRSEALANLGLKHKVVVTLDVDDFRFQVLEDFNNP